MTSANAYSLITKTIHIFVKKHKFYAKDFV